MYFFYHPVSKKVSIFRIQPWRIASHRLSICVDLSLSITLLANSDSPPPDLHCICPALRIESRQIEGYTDGNVLEKKERNLCSLIFRIVKRETQLQKTKVLVSETQEKGPSSLMWILVLYRQKPLHECLPPYWTEITVIIFLSFRKYSKMYFLTAQRNC